jgi:hypothetical protein
MSQNNRGKEYKNKPENSVHGTPTMSFRPIAFCLIDLAQGRGALHWPLTRLHVAVDLLALREIAGNAPDL